MGGVTTKASIMCSCWTSSGYSEVLWQRTVTVIQRGSGGLRRAKDIYEETWLFSH